MSAFEASVSRVPAGSLAPGDTGCVAKERRER